MAPAGNPGPSRPNGLAALARPSWTVVAVSQTQPKMFRVQFARPHTAEHHGEAKPGTAGFVDWLERLALACCQAAGSARRSRPNEPTWNARANFDKPGDFALRQMVCGSCSTLLRRRLPRRNRRRPRLIRRRGRLTNPGRRHRQLGRGHRRATRTDYLRSIAPLPHAIDVDPDIATGACFAKRLVGLLVKLVFPWWRVKPNGHLVLPRNRCAGVQGKRSGERERKHCSLDRPVACLCGNLDFPCRREFCKVPRGRDAHY